MNCKVFQNYLASTRRRAASFQRRKRLSPSSRERSIRFQGSAWANNAIGQMVTLKFAMTQRADQLVRYGILSYPHRLHPASIVGGVFGSGINLGVGRSGHRNRHRYH